MIFNMHEQLTVDSFSQKHRSFRDQIIEGLNRSPKLLPSKFLYDKRGSELFEQICQLPEYYPTRTESGILARYTGEIADLCGPDCLLVELGSGSSTKTRLLLNNLRDPVAYIPIDIAHEQLYDAAWLVQRDYPGLEVMPICADYTADFVLPQPSREPSRQVTFFPGSTIGNFEPDEARRFLARFAESSRMDDVMIVGVDLIKSRRILERAYNDREGVTAAFNLNLLYRINHELGADIEVERFCHKSVFNQSASRIEMHLVSTAEQIVRIGARQFRIGRGESIISEHSYKYTLDGFAGLARAAGFHTTKAWTDQEHQFSIHYLRVA
jgi:dimethylhistidine N-methyltransferase